MTSARGTCFGFEVRSERTFRYLRHGTGQPLVVDGLASPGAGTDDRLLWEWRPPRFPFTARLYGDGRRYRLWVTDVGWFEVDAHEPRIRMPEAPDTPRLEERLWGVPTLLCFLARGDHALHAAAVEVDGGAVLIGAPGRFGKTTLAAAFLGAGHRVLAEDLSCLRPGAEPAIVPGPAMLRVRHDVAERLEVPGSLVVDRSGDRVHLAMEPDRRGDGEPVPLRGIVLLRSDDAPPRLERVDATDALPDLWALSFHLPTNEDRSRCFTGIVDIAAAVPVWNLHRRVSFEDLPATIDRIATAFAHV